MEILALIGAVLIAIVFVAERLAFAVMLYLLIAWLWSATTGLRAVIHREVLRAAHAFRRVHQSLLHWWAMRALRGQLARGATP